MYRTYYTSVVEHYLLFTGLYTGWRLAQQLRALLVLVEDLAMIPSPIIATHNWL